MAQFRKKPVVIEAITFEEFVDFAKKNTEEPHWSIPYQGVNVTHENDELYIIPTLEGNHNFTPEDMLITGVKGEIYPCKKDIFKATYDLVEKQEGMTFGEAIQELKQGKLVARKGWNGKNMFLFIRPADELTTGFIPKVKSLPESAKVWIDKNMDDKVNPGESGLTPVKFTEYICMKAADNSIVNGWLASQTDMLSEDWEIIS